jgi:hypothetical protein
MLYLVPKDRDIILFVIHRIRSHVYLLWKFYKYVATSYCLLVVLCDSSVAWLIICETIFKHFLILFIVFQN